MLTPLKPALDLCNSYICFFLEATRYHLTLIEIGLVLVNALYILSFCTSDSHLYLMFLNLMIRSFFLSPHFVQFDSFYMYDIMSTSWLHVMWKTTSQRAVWLVRTSVDVMRYFYWPEDNLAALQYKCNREVF